MVLPESITPGDTGHIGHHELLHALFNSGLRVIEGVVADGVTDNTAAIQDAIDNANSGDTLLLPAGPIVTGPLTINKMLHLRGMGRFSTWLIPLSNTASPLLTVDVTIDSGFGIFANYGPSLSGFSIQRLGHMAGPCIRTTSNTAWLTITDLLCSGGTRSIEHHAPNSTFEDVLLWDCSDAMIDMDESGLELHLRKVVMAANVTALNRFIRVTIVSGGGLKGAIYADDVTGNAIASVNTGMSVIAPSLTEVPIKATKLVLDNVVGGGPVLDLVNIQSFSMANGWLNGSNGCVRLAGCVNPRFSDIRTRGGTHTFEFVGATTQGFTSRCEVFTGPAYKISTANKPTLIDVDDDVAGATDIGQVTNDAAWFMAESTHRRKWTSLRLQGLLRQREGGATPPQGFGNMVSGVLTVTHASVTPNTRVEFWRGTTGVAPGELHHDVADNIAGTSFKIKSTSATDNGRVHWRILGDAD